MKPTSVVSGLVLASLAILTATLAWRSSAWPLIHDAPIMHYIAWRIGEGAVPYRDLFDMNFPGVYLIHLAVIRLLGPGDGAWRAFDLAWLAVTSASVAALAAPWGGVAALGGALFFAAYHLAGGAWLAGQRDFLLCPFLLLAALGVARWIEARGGGAAARPARRARRGELDLVWGGLALGAGITIKPHAALLGVALAAVVAGAAWRAGGTAWGPVLTFGASMAPAPLAVVGWLGASGALGAWREIVFDYLLPLYSRLGRPARWTFHRWHVWLPIGAALALSLGHALRRRGFTPRHGVATLGLGYGLAHFFGQGKGWEYHLYPLAAFAAVLLFSELRPLAARAVAAAAVVASLAAIVVLLSVKGTEAAGPPWIAEKERRVSRVVETLAPRIRAGDLVQVLDTTEGGVHALLRLRAVEPTRFLYDFPFYHDTEAPMVRRLRAELIAGLEGRPPRFVVLFERSWPAGGYERLARFPELARRLAAGYRVEARGDGYVIYAKRHDP